MASFQEENRSMMTCEQSWLDPKVGFQPTDQQLITNFLNKKISGNPLPMNMVIDEVQFRNYNPTQLSSNYSFSFFSISHNWGIRTFLFLFHL